MSDSLQAPPNASRADPASPREALEGALREACAVLNEGRATLETMNEARLAVARCLDPPPDDPELRTWIEGVVEGLRTDCELTRTGVVTRIADAQAALRAALSRLATRDGSPE